MNTPTHTLQFKGSNGKVRDIATIQDENKTDKEILEEAMLHIRAFCAERHFKIYYTRIWNAGGKTIFDVGSHTEFFYLIPEVSWENDASE